MEMTNTLRYPIIRKRTLRNAEDKWIGNEILFIYISTRWIYKIYHNYVQYY